MAATSTNPETQTTNGHRSVPRDIGEHGHACLVYSSEEELSAGVRAYLEDGIALGQRIACVGPDEESMRAALVELRDLDRLVETGALVLISLDAVWLGSDPIEPEAQLAVYAQAADQAIADGYTGLRIAGLGTQLVRNRSHWAGHCRWESFADRHMKGIPLSALCCYDVRELGPAITHDLACVHPVSAGTTVAPSFHLFHQGQARALGGEIDAFSADELQRILVLTENDPRDAQLDLSEITFIDHHAALKLEEYRRKGPARGIEIGFTGSSAAVGRVAELLEIEL